MTGRGAARRTGPACFAARGPVTCFHSRAATPPRVDPRLGLQEHLDLEHAVHIDHSTGGGEVVRYLACHGESRVAKAAIIAAVPLLMGKAAANPGGRPKKVFDGFQAQVATNRQQFHRDVASAPFDGCNRPGAKPAEGVIRHWWQQGMMGGANAHYDGIVAFSQTDFTEDRKKIDVPVLVMHGDDDPIVPYADAAPLSAWLLKHGTLKTCTGFPHGRPTTHDETINKDLLAFIRARAALAWRAALSRRPTRRDPVPVGANRANRSAGRATRASAVAAASTNAISPSGSRAAAGRRRPR